MSIATAPAFSARDIIDRFAFDFFLMIGPVREQELFVWQRSWDYKICISKTPCGCFSFFTVAIIIVPVHPPPNILEGFKRTNLHIRSEIETVLPSRQYLVVYCY